MEALMGLDENDLVSLNLLVDQYEFSEFVCIWLVLMVDYSQCVDTVCFEKASGSINKMFGDRHQYMSAC